MCSSDLKNEYEVKVKVVETHFLIINADNEEDAVKQAESYEIGRASCRERV